MSLVDHVAASRSGRRHKQLRENSGQTRGEMRAAKKLAARIALSELLFRPVERFQLPNVQTKPAANRQSFATIGTLEVVAVYPISRGPKPTAAMKASRIKTRTAPFVPICRACPGVPCDPRDHDVPTRRLTDDKGTWLVTEAPRVNRFADGAQKPSKAFTYANPRTFDERPCVHEHAGDECLIPKFVY